MTGRRVVSRSKHKAEPDFINAASDLIRSEGDVHAKGFEQVR